MKIINTKIEGYLQVVIFIYFLGIALYSLIPDVIKVLETTQKIFYWSNNTFLIVNFLFILSKFVIELRTKILLLGTSIFFLILGIFQILFSLGCSIPDYFWAIFCPLYILLNLITYKICQRRNGQEKTGRTG